MVDGNGGPLAGLKGYLTEIDVQDDELESLRSEYMNSCKAPRQAIKEIKASAKEAGVNMKAFAEILTEHRETRAHEKRLAALEPDDFASYEEMERVLGDFGSTPLGDSALQRAKHNEEALDSLNN